MANEVAALNTYHNGASYSVAELYDDEIAEYKKSFIENARGAVHFDTDTGIVAEITKINTATLNPQFYANGSVVADVTPYVTTEHAKFDYALQFSASNKNYLANPVFGPIAGRAYTMEGWFYVDTTADSDTGTLFSYMATSGNNPQAIRSVIYSYNKENGVVKPKLNDIDVAAGTFDAPFHIAHIWRGNAIGHVNFCNGKHFQTIAYKGTDYWANSKSSIGGVYIGVNQKSTSGSGNYYVVSNTTPYFTGYCSEFKVITGALYTADFTPPNKSSVWAKIPVEGNVAFKSASGTLYAPLSSDATYKTPPCLNVRHNGTNYFAIK